MPNRRPFPRCFALTLVLLVAGCALPASGTREVAVVQSQPPLTASPALPDGDDLTLAQNAGSILIGLTLRPAQPGPNTLLVYVLPIDGPVAAADVPVHVAIDGQPVLVETCSRTCRGATVTLQGGEHVNVIADGASGGAAEFVLPALPAADGTALLQELNDRMHQLRTYRVYEMLGPAAPLVQAEYTFAAPDRMRLELADGASTVWVGPTRYSRDGAAGAWRGESVGISLAVPSFVWDRPASASAYVGAHVLGTESVDGLETQVLAFFLSVGQMPAWFRLWVDRTGLVQRAAMRAQGYFMEHRYTEFEAKLSVDPPEAVPPAAPVPHV